MENPHINIKFVIYWQHCLLCVESILWDLTRVSVDRVEEHYGDWSSKRQSRVDVKLGTPTHPIASDARMAPLRVLKVPAELRA